MREDDTLKENPHERGFTQAQREIVLRKPLERFKRNRAKPEELEALRYRLIQARVTQGMMAVEAAREFGYANSSQLSQIESGVRPTPSDWRFLKQAAEVYAVSTDWLLGLSPSMEPDSRVVREHALLRGTENLVRAFIGQMTSLLIETARQTNATEEELARVLDDAGDVSSRFAKFAARPEFLDMPGGAPVLAAVERLAAGVAPLRKKLAKLQAVEAALNELKSGNAISPAKFIEFFRERDAQAGGALADDDTRPKETRL
ncbi:XRE family transcriptional regulator [Caballeronia sp. LZ019]|uniref:XRE family transcriptional regulator n=1 Tax=Caballeronia sp. LZ019 TaxID=3038555 RepID=UPI00285A87F3|nr:XRE family transcriptional regulator [Caballeronia sp. LZ019]MDR5809531.1 XRE family transcriptional regulator [Caballeronia sp. LZ019]